jgi:hypothetical protein
MFDIGFPPALLKSIRDMFHASTYAVWLVSFQPPRTIIKRLGYMVTLIKQLSTNMHGKS